MGANVQLRNISSASHFQSRSPADALWISLRAFVKAQFSSQVTHIRVLHFTFSGPFLLLCASFRSLASTAMVVFCSQVQLLRPGVVLFFVCTHSRRSAEK